MPLRSLVAGFFTTTNANEAGNNEDAILLQLGVTDGGHGLDDALDVLAGEVGSVLLDEGLDQVGFRKGTFGHCISLGWDRTFRAIFPSLNGIPAIV